MGRIAKLLSFVRLTKNEAKVSDVKVNPGGGPNITAEHFADAGDDAHPLVTDYVALNTDSGSGRETAIGYLDPLNEPKAQPGDKRIYGRDADTGEAVVEVWLKNDGTAMVSNANGSFELKASGDFLVNGVTIDTSGNITSPATITAPNVAGNTSVQAAGKELAGHVHPAGTPPGNTGPNS